MMQKNCYLMLNCVLLRSMCVLVALIGRDGIASHCVTGPARIVTTSNQLGKVCNGEIVVAVRTQSSWEPSLKLAAGIIVDQGDKNCHAAVFGKKLGIPVIVGAGNATTTISNGQTVTIDSFKNMFYCQSVVTTAIKPGQRISGVFYVASHSSGSGHGQCNAMQNNSSFGGIKNLYTQHLVPFERYVLDLKKQLANTPDSLVKWGARWVRGYNEFTIACIPISYPFFFRDNRYIQHILQSITNEKYLNCIASSLERCRQKPRHLALFDWVAQVSHEEHIKNIDLPTGIIKAELMAHPEKYEKIITQVSEQERDALIAVGLFARYLAEHNLL